MPVIKARIGGAWVAIGGGGVAPTAWTAMPLLNGWSDYGGGYQAAQYRKVGDEVQLRGLIKQAVAAAPSVIATMPVGFRPAGNYMFGAYAAASAGGMARVDVVPAGDVVMNALPTGTTGAAGFLSLDHMRFSTTA